MLTLTICWSAPAAAESVYETRNEFVNRAFSNSPPETSVIWLTGERKMNVSRLLGHDYSSLRLRYWCQAGRSAWILEEIGKDLPITVGVIVDNSQIKSLRVLTYRENRGGEVVVPAFTDQFNGVRLDANGDLNATINGISGATLSVHALTRLGAIALLLHGDTGCEDGP